MIRLQRLGQPLLRLLREVDPLVCQLELLQAAVLAQPRRQRLDAPVPARDGGRGGRRGHTTRRTPRRAPVGERGKSRRVCGLCAYPVLIELLSRLSAVSVVLLLSTSPHTCPSTSETRALTISTRWTVALVSNARTTARRSLSVARIQRL
eukprot:6578195-Prymnesium_polylepis.2